MSGRRGRRAATLALVVLAGWAPRLARGGEPPPPDSSEVFSWGGLYRTELDVRREAGGFPWNDEERTSALRDRLAVFAMRRIGPGLALFAKGATGVRLDGEGHDNRFSLAQAHVAWSAMDGAATARLHSRERIHASNHRLMKLASDESSFLAGRGEGMRIDAGAGDRFRVTWIESSLREPGLAFSTGGLPLLRGGADIFRSVRVEARAIRRVRAGALFQQVRSIGAGDAVIAGADLALEAGGASLIAELARSIPGTPDDLADASLFGIDLGAFDLDRPSRVFSERSAFAAAVEGFRIDAGRFGSAGLVPAYRFCGSAFSDAPGEMAPSAAETSALLWYRPRALDMLASVTVADTASGGPGGWYVAALIRERLRGGLEAAHRLAVREGGRTSASLSLASDAPRSRTHLTVLLDDVGGRNDLSCFAGGTFNLGAHLDAGCSLYLPRPGVVRYCLSCELRARERFLLTVSGGSFVPAFEEISIAVGGVPLETAEDRAVTVAGRVRFGGM